MGVTFRVRLFLLASRFMSPMEKRDVVEIRSDGDRFVERFKPRTPIAVGAVRDLVIPGQDAAIPARLYSPAAPGPHPLLIYYHGGGFVLGTLAMYDGLCREFCHEVGCAVLSVDYRLAPEHPFPAAPDDAIVAARHAFTHAHDLGIDTSRIAVGGDSAGGNLAAVAAIALRNDGGHRLAGQLLIYPVATHHDDGFESRRTNGKGYFLTKTQMDWFSSLYGATEANQDWRASPINLDDFSGLAPALIITAEFDPLRDEGEAYGDRLKAAGVPVEVSRYAGVLHGFLSMKTLFPEGRRAFSQSCAWLRDRFALADPEQAKQPG